MKKLMTFLQRRLVAALMLASVLAVLLVSVGAIGCAGAQNAAGVLQGVDKVNLAIAAACETIELGKCWTDPILQAALPGIDYATCRGRVKQAIAQWPTALTSAEYSKLISKKPSCLNVYDGLRWPIGPSN